MATLDYLNALNNFRRARRRAKMETVLARFQDHPSLLLSYDEVRRITDAQGEVRLGLQDIAIDNIAGSVGRYADFTRTFLPRNDSMEERWARVMALATSQEGWPPIEVYQIGDVYFVLDGHHRVSAAREMGLATFPAYVIEVGTRVPVRPDDDVETLILRAEQHHFARQTGLVDARPDCHLEVTEADGYRTLLEHIAVHRYYMGVEEQREVPFREAAIHWYDAVYQPLAATIRRTGLLDEFPQRTETDLYLWLSRQQAQLEAELERSIAAERAADDLKRQDRSWQRRLALLWHTVRRGLAAGTPRSALAGPQ